MLWGLCKCSGGEICVFCKIATAVMIGAVGLLIGYFLGKRKK